MILLGLLLIAIAVAAGTGVAVSSSDTASVQVFGHSAHSHQVAVIFVAGAIAGVHFALGASLIMAAMTRRRARRRDARRTERARVAEQRELRERNAELERSLSQERAATATTTDGAGTPRSVDLNQAAAERQYAEPGRTQ